MASGHAAYSLSELDLRMVSSVPQGGNWKNIPTSIPSKRLEQIRSTGGRTTLYGRLRWDAPSYTVTTYFNRPGNGCYIHPDENRVLTSWEAARLQSFPDSYVFSGSKGSRTKQIGNAVPPILAYALGLAIKDLHPEMSTYVDLFSGAGGLSLGLRWAGFNTLVANDFFREAGETYASNNPDVEFLFGDITEQSIQRRIFDKVESAGGVDMVVGGPPCQGFSNAGLRMIDDPRNLLYKQFVEVVKVTKPRVVVMENVEGILSINGGRTYQEIENTFRDIGYHVSGRKLLAAEFGVPQKRKRVVIIGSRFEDSLDLFPRKVVSEGNYLTVRDAIGDVPFETAENAFENIKPGLPRTVYQKLMQGECSPEEFFQSIQNS